MAMGFDDSVNGEQATRTLIQCSDPECGKWRFTTVHALDKIFAKDEQAKWTCKGSNGCASPEDPKIYDHLDRSPHFSIISPDAEMTHVPSAHRPCSR